MIALAVACGLFLFGYFLGYVSGLSDAAHADRTLDTEVTDAEVIAPRRLPR